jgi:hypothetical protein
VKPLPFRRYISGSILEALHLDFLGDFDVLYHTLELVFAIRGGIEFKGETVRLTVLDSDLSMLVDLGHAFHFLESHVISVLEGVSLLLINHADCFFVVRNSSDNE